MTFAQTESSWQPPGVQQEFLKQAYVCQSLEEMRAFASKLAQVLKPGMTLGLSGALGAGKTTFVRALAENFGVLNPEDVTSPTYALLHIYETSRPPHLVHLDLYRLDGPNAAIALGLDEEFVHSDGLVLVEWAELMPTLLPRDMMWLRIDVLDQDRRRFTLFTQFHVIPL